MISHDAQQANIKAEQDKRIPFGIKAVKWGIEVLVAAGCVYVAHEHGQEAAQYIDTLLHSHEPLKNVMGFTWGEILTYFVGTPAYIGATKVMIDEAVRQRFGKLR